MARKKRIEYPGAIYHLISRESGHVFQGRYKAILIGGDRSLLSLVDYIHLNPVRAGLCDPDGLRDYELSSYPKYWKGKVRAGLVRGGFLAVLGEPDGLAGMRRYKKHLELSEAKDPAQRDALMKRYCSGWFIGPEEEGKALARELAEKHPNVDWEGMDLRQLNEQRWEALVVNELKGKGKMEEDLIRSPKGADWKIAIARQLRKQTTANNPWIAERLKMGHPSRVSNLLANKASFI